MTPQAILELIDWLNDVGNEISADTLKLYLENIDKRIADLEKRNQTWEKKWAFVRAVADRLKAESVLDHEGDNYNWYSRGINAVTGTMDYADEREVWY